MKYPWLKYNEIVKYEPQMDKYKVSLVARGKVDSTATDKGFLQIYKTIDDPKKMYKIMATDNQSWGDRRDAFISRHLPQYRDNPTLRRKLSLIAWAYMPNIN